MLRKIFVVLLLVMGLTGLVQAQDNTLSLGQPISGTLDTNAPTQEWVFNAQPGTQTSLNVTRTNGDAPLTVTMIRNPNTIVVSLRTNNDGIINLPLLYLEGGDYRVRLVGDFGDGAGPTDFELLILPVGTTPSVTQQPTPTRQPAATAMSDDTTTLEEPIRLEIGDVYEGELERDGEVHRFSFLGYADSRVTFGMSRQDETATLDPYIQLQAPNGDIIIENNDYAETPDALVVYFELPATGVYTLYASSLNDQGTGPYIVAVGENFILRDIEQGNAIHNQPNIATLTAYGARDVWYIDAQAGDVISIAVDNWGDDYIDPMVELVSPEGEILGFDDDSGEGDSAVLAYQQVPVSGVYRIHVAAYNHASIGTYRLIWSREGADDEPTEPPLPTATVSPTESPTITPTPTATVPPTPPPALTEAGGSIEGSIEPGETFARAIDAQAGQQLDIYVEGNWGFDAVLEVQTESGVVVALVDDTGYDSTYDINPRLQMTVQVSGRYILNIYGYDSSGGSFTLNWLLQ